MIKTKFVSIHSNLLELQRGVGGGYRMQCQLIFSRMNNIKEQAWETKAAQ